MTTLKKLIKQCLLICRLAYMFATDQQLVTLPDGHIKIISKGSNQQHSEMDTATASLPSSAVNIVHLNETVSFPRGASLQNSDGVCDLSYSCKVFVISSFLCISFSATPLRSQNDVIPLTM